MSKADTIENVSRRFKTMKAFPLIYNYAPWLITTFKKESTLSTLASAFVLTVACKSGGVSEIMKV
jgi:hypothetical protein